jgi:hypothetical protein
MSHAQSQQETHALCELYRQTLTQLLDVIAVSALLHDPSVQEALAHAAAILHAESPYALAEQRRSQAYENHCFELADWAHHQLYQRPRTAHGYVPPDHEICRILEEIHALVQEGYALEAHRPQEG